MPKQTIDDAERRERKRAADRAYAAAHREEAKAKARAWYYANKERAKASRKQQYDAVKNAEYQRLYREKNAERLRQYDRERNKTEARKLTHQKWREKNSAKVVDRVKDWAAANPDKARMNGRNTEARRRARLKSAPVESIDLMEVYRANDGICGLCAQPVAEADFEIDHIVPIAAGGGHTRLNVHIAHKTCNRKKSASLSVRIYSL